MESIVFATNNRHKLEEIRQMATNKFRILGLPDIGFTGEIDETGNTLEENASIKSNFVFNRYGMSCFADDTGLEVEALNGRPGVYSARYAGEEGNARKNIEKLLYELKVEKNRKAAFRTVISLIINGEESLFYGEVKGKIIAQERGIAGFGYDPIFIPDGYDQTFAELPAKVKNSISHRAKAVEKLFEFLNGAF